jgi:hypothetical protein
MTWSFVSTERLRLFPGFSANLALFAFRRLSRANVLKYDQEPIEFSVGNAKTAERFLVKKPFDSPLRPNVRSCRTENTDSTGKA